MSHNKNDKRQHCYTDDRLWTQENITKYETFNNQCNAIYLTTSKHLRITTKCNWLWHVNLFNDSTNIYYIESTIPDIIIKLGRDELYAYAMVKLGDVSHVVGYLNSDVELDDGSWFEATIELNGNNDIVVDKHNDNEIILLKKINEAYEKSKQGIFTNIGVNEIDGIIAILAIHQTWTQYIQNKIINYLTSKINQDELLRSLRLEKRKVGNYIKINISDNLKFNTEQQLQDIQLVALICHFGDNLIDRNNLYVYKYLSSPDAINMYKEIRDGESWSTYYCFSDMSNYVHDFSTINIKINDAVYLTNTAIETYQGLNRIKQMAKWSTLKIFSGITLGMGPITYNMSYLNDLSKDINVTNKISKYTYKQLLHEKKLITGKLKNLVSMCAIRYETFGSKLSSNTACYSKYSVEKGWNTGYDVTCNDLNQHGVLVVTDGMMSEVWQAVAFADEIITGTDDIVQVQQTELNKSWHRVQEKGHLQDSQVNCTKVFVGRDDGYIYLQNAIVYSFKEMVSFTNKIYIDDLTNICKLWKKSTKRLRKAIERLRNYMSNEYNIDISSYEILSRLENEIAMELIKKLVTRKLKKNIKKNIKFYK